MKASDKEYVSIPLRSDFNELKNENRTLLKKFQSL